MKWDNAEVSKCRIGGAEGKVIIFLKYVSRATNFLEFLQVDILCINPTSWCCYYPEHLPILGETRLNSCSSDKLGCAINILAVSNLKGAPHSPPKETEIMSGDLVQVQLDPDVFKMMQNEEHGGWNDRMAMVSCSPYLTL